MQTIDAEAAPANGDMVRGRLGSFGISERISIAVVARVSLGDGFELAVSCTVQAASREG